MHVVIDIPKVYYELIKENNVIVRIGRGSGKTIIFDLLKAVQNGTPLPKGHELFKDYGCIDKNFDIQKVGGINWVILNKTQTTSELDKE